MKSQTVTGMIIRMKQSNITTYLKQDNHTLGNLLFKLNQLKTWNSWLRAALPADSLIMDHCQIVGLDRTSLIVIADNAHWVTRFRFLIPQLLTQLQQYPELKNIRSICCKVRPALHPTIKKTQRQPLQISATTAEILQETAQKISDQKLKKILQRMAQR